MRSLALIFAISLTVVACNDSTSAAPGNASVAGKVILQGETDHSGIAVTLSGPVMRAVRTDSAGAYLFDGVPAGSYAVVATARSTREASQVTTVGVEATKRAQAPDLTFLPLGQVSGKVTYGTATGNAGIVVAVAGSSAVAVTDDLGRYALNGVPTGARDVVASAAGYGNAAAPAVQVKYAAEVAAPELSLTKTVRPGKLQGQATILGQTASPGLVITLTGPSSAVALTAADGTWSVSDLAAGNYIATAAAPYTLEGTLSQSVVIANELKNLPALTFTPSGSITGVVTLDGEPGAGVLVYLPGGAATFTDGAGAFTLRGMPARANVVVQAMRVGFDLGSSAPVTVPYANAVAVTIALHRAQNPGEAALGSTVSLVGGVPPDGLNVSLCDAQDASLGVPGVCAVHTSRPTATDAYSFAALKDGVYALDFRKGPYIETIPAAVALPGSNGLVADTVLYPLSPIEVQRGARVRSLHDVQAERGSPDGDRIAYNTDVVCLQQIQQNAAPAGQVGLGCFGLTSGTLEVANADGTHVVAGANAMVGTHQFSPHGDAVLFVSDYNPSAEGGSMHVLCPDSTVRNLGQQSYGQSLPALAWSHAGDLGAWADHMGNLVLFDVASCSTTTLATGVAQATVSFTADDKTLFFQTFAGVRGEFDSGYLALWFVPVDGGDPVLVHSGMGPYQLMNGTQTGEYVAWLSDDAYLHTQRLPTTDFDNLRIAGNVQQYRARATGDLLVLHNYNQTTGYDFDYLSPLDGTEYQHVSGGVQQTTSNTGERYAFTALDDSGRSALLVAQPGVNAEDGGTAYTVSPITSENLTDWQLSQDESSVAYTAKHLDQSENTVYDVVLANVLTGGNVIPYAVGTESSPPAQLHVSPEGQYAGYVAPSGTLKLFSVSDEGVQTLGAQVQGWTYSGEGHALAGDMVSDGGTEVIVAQASGAAPCPPIGGIDMDSVSLAPGGTAITFETNVAASRSDRPLKGLLHVLPLEACAPTALVSSSARGGFLSGDRTYGIRIESAPPYRFQDGIYFSDVPYQPR